MRKEQRNQTFRFVNIIYNFMEVRSMLESSTSYVYANEIKKLVQKDIELCEIKIPFLENIKYTTNLELLGKYNEQMLDIFDPFELELEIIPRKELDGQAISASRIRRHMPDGECVKVFL